MLRVAIDIQAVANKRTGVGHFTYHLVKALPHVVDTGCYTLFLFDFRRRFRDGSLGGGNVFLKKIGLPGFLVRCLWDAFGTPPVERLTGPFDLFHFTNYAVPPMRENRALTTIYDMSFLRLPQYTDPQARKWPLRYAAQSAERALAVITVSEFSKAEITGLLGIPPEKVHVVYPGVSPAFRGQGNGAEGSRLPARYGLSDPYILCVGTLEPRKNIPTLLRAYGKKASFFRRRGCRLLLVGMKGWLYEEIFRTVRAHGLQQDVRFSGYVADDELIPIYRGAEFAVFPSFYEGFGMPLLEAMASSTPVLASDIAAHREVLGDAGLFFEPGDEEGLAQRMMELYENQGLRERLAGEGSRRALRFTWEASAASLVDVYRRVAAGKA